MRHQPVRIVPPATDKNGITLTQGTQVLLGDVPLKNVTKIILTADVNDIWRAEIHCMVKMQPMDAMARIYYPKPWKVFWRHFKNWFKILPADRGDE